MVDKSSLGNKLSHSNSANFNGVTQSVRSTIKQPTHTYTVTHSLSHMPFNYQSSTRDIRKGSIKPLSSLTTESVLIKWQIRRQQVYNLCLHVLFMNKLSKYRNEASLFKTMK